MGILDLLTVIPEAVPLFQKSRQSDRDKRILREGSPTYTWTPGSIAASARLAIYLDTEFPDSRKYAPLDKVEIINNDAVDLDIIINASETWHCPAGTIRKIEGGIGIRHCEIFNLDAATATTQYKVVLRFQRAPASADKYYQNLMGG